MFKRLLALPQKPKHSFFLWGPRLAGKSTLLKSLYSEAIWLDLLKSDEFRRYTMNPEWLRTEILREKKGALVVIDEIQKVPQLLDEVHWLIENQHTTFVLCGSSARKLRRGHANLLGGRALRYELYGLICPEIGKDFNLDRMLNHGYTPKHYLSQNYRPLLNAYISDYLKEEIAAEGLVRNLPGFSYFLDMASLSDTELINFSTIARDCGVSSHTVQEYFQILVDTLLGTWVEAYRKRPKRRVIGAPKFYFYDVGVVNLLSKRKDLEPGSELFGKAFENWIFHELNAHRHYTELNYSLTYWRLASGIEVDFIMNDMEIAIEAKATKKVTSDHLKGLRNIIQDHPKISKRIIVCLETKERKTEDGIIIFPAENFIRRLWDNLNFDR